MDINRKILLAAVFVALSTCAGLAVWTFTDILMLKAAFVLLVVGMAMIFGASALSGDGYEDDVDSFSLLGENVDDNRNDNAVKQHNSTNQMIGTGGFDESGNIW